MLFPFFLAMYSRHFFKLIFDKISANRAFLYFTNFLKTSQKEEDKKEQEKEEEEEEEEENTCLHDLGNPLYQMRGNLNIINPYE